MQVQPTPTTGNQTAAKPAAGAVDGQAFPTSLLNALSLIPQPPPQGPEPPFLPPRTTRGAEEAAKVPNVTSQKLDSPHPKTQPTIAPVVAPDVTALSLTLPTTGQAQAQVAAVSNKVKPVEAKVNPISISKPAVQALKPDTQADSKTTQAPEKPEAPAQTLPTDQVAPITSVKTTQSEALPTDKTTVESGSTPVHSVKQASTTSASKDDVTTVAQVAGAAKAASQSKGGGSFGSSRQSRQDKPSEAPISAVSTATATKTSAVKAPAEVTELQGLDRTALVKQVADKMQALAASRSKDGVIVQLAPKALGTITVTLKSLGNGMDAHLVASNDQVRKALEQSRPDLVQTMSNRGYRLTAVTVSQESASTTSGNKQQQLPNQQRQSTAAQSRANTNFESSSTVSTVDRPTSANNAGVDLWI